VAVERKNPPSFLIELFVVQFNVVTTMRLCAKKPFSAVGLRTPNDKWNLPQFTGIVSFRRS
jgi:hypothetical protein